MTTTIRATGPAHFLSLVPHLLGYTPTRSLVLIPFTGTRTAGAIRVDLPTVPEQQTQAAHVLAGILCRIPDADGLAAIIYDTHTHPSHAALIGEIDRQADRCGLTVIDRLYVTTDGYGRVGHAAEPLADIAPVAIEGMTLRGGDQHSASALPAPDLALLEAALEADVTAMLGERDAFVDMVERVAAAADTLDPEVFAFVMTACERPAQRDIMIVGVLSGPEHTARAWDAQAAWEAGQGYPADIARVMWGEGPRPDTTRLHHLDRILRHVAAAQERTRPGVLATLAWVSWALGHSTTASDFAAASLVDQLGHGLAEIVTAFVDAGHLPDWAFHRR